MIGIYDYTVILTYISLISASSGIMITLSSNGNHPYLGMFFLLICGLCDAFDGKVARSKKGRTDFECKFGIQIDSLCDLVSFGVLPSVIGYACGIAKKIIEAAGLLGVTPKSGFIFVLSFFFYVLNFVEISIDVALYFRNKKLDEAAEQAAKNA